MSFGGGTSRVEVVRWRKDESLDQAQRGDWRETVSEGQEDEGMYLRKGKSSVLVETLKKGRRERGAISRGPCALTLDPRIRLRHGE